MEGMVSAALSPVCRCRIGVSEWWATRGKRLHCAIHTREWKASVRWSCAGVEGDDVLGEEYPSSGLVVLGESAPAAQD
jgi:hypothetical protein